jgi:hypothetical protein
VTTARPGLRRARIVPVAVAVLASTLALGCAALRSPRPVAIPPTDVRPLALLEGLARAGDARRSLRAVARLGIEGPAGEARAKQVLLVERPAQLRVEILGLLDQRVAVLTTDGVEYRLFRAEDRSLTGGPVHPALLWDVAGLAVTPEQAVRLLLAAPAWPDEARLVGGHQLADGRVELSLRVPEAAESFRIAFDAAGRLLEWMRLDAHGEPLQAARWSDHRPLGDDSFPYQLDLEEHATGARAQVRFLSVELNPVLAPDLFELQLGGRE